MVMARDETLAPPLWPDGDRNISGYRPPETLFDDRFDRSFCGWRDHAEGAGATVVNRNAISLTTLRTWSDSDSALMLSTSGRGTTAMDQTASAATYKNLSRNFDTGLVRFEAWVALGGADLTNGPLSWSMLIDSQSWGDGGSENLHRGFPILSAMRFDPADVTQRKNAWAIINDAGQYQYITREGTSRTTPPGSRWGSPPMAGDNQVKLNVMRVALWYDMTNVYSADGKPGGYYAAEMGNKFYDLRPFGAGRRIEAPVGTAGDLQGFQGGLNFGLGLKEKPGPAPGPSFLVVLRARALHYSEAS